MREELDPDAPPPARHDPAARERSIAALAARQHGLVTIAQLSALGFGRSAVGRRVDAGRLHRVHRGVYAVGHPVLTTPGRRLAAVLACGPSAVLSHTSAAAIWELRVDDGGITHVTVARALRATPRAGTRVHTTRRLPLEERAMVDAMPLTSVARTLVDLGDVLSARRVRGAFVRAEQLRLIDMRAVHAALAGARHRPGAAILREVLRGYDPRWQDTLSRLELLTLDVLAAHDLPEPEVNAWIENRYLADFLWREQRVILESDGDAVHATPGARRADARRDRDLARRGYRTLRATTEELHHRPHELARRLRGALRAR
ncbi:MAG TPA: type IV toxin-antitoxin system AbiEi family antitoxin domain-containing protein [Solirubrobacteraceae bacterium]|nr:type IV toxin-antitoxin system AbiEi family antitoxin domain-containing protein [Solirubrobacteraceae bacterium]